MSEAVRNGAAAEAAEPAIEVEDLTVAYADSPVLWDVDLEVPAGVLMAIVGPNGAGKTDADPGGRSGSSGRPPARCASSAGRTRSSGGWWRTCRSAAAWTGISRRPSSTSSRWAGTAASAGSAARADGSASGAWRRWSRWAWRISRAARSASSPAASSSACSSPAALVQDAERLPDGRAVPGRRRDDRAGHRACCRRCAPPGRPSWSCTTTSRPCPSTSTG